MSGKHADELREGLVLAENEDDDPGIHVLYPGLPKDQTVVIRSVLVDGMLDSATEAANRTGTYKNAIFRATLIKSMVLKCNVKNRKIDPASGNPYFDLKDDATLRKLPAPFLAWLAAEIQQCNGSVDRVSEVEIGGVMVTFRQTA